MENKKKIIVELDSRIAGKFHPMYNSFFNYPPKGVEYKTAEFNVGKGKNASILRIVYKKIEKALNKFFPHLIQKVIDLLKKDKEDVDLVYFANHIGETKKPFIVDYEDATAFMGGWENFHDKRRKKEIEKYFTQKNLKFLLPYSKQSLKSFELFFKDFDLKEKQKVISPVVFVPEKFRKKVKKEDIVVFVTSTNSLHINSFCNKGGFESVLAFERLAKKFPKVKFLLFAKLPSEIKVKERKNLKIMGPTSQDKLWETLNKARIFVQPSYGTPTMAYLEAMWFKLPIVTYDTWANKDYVDKKNGILITPEKCSIFNEYNVMVFYKENIEEIKRNAPKNALKIEKAVTYLLKNKKKAEKMGEEGFKKVSKGKFSIENRNKKIKEIYLKALKE